MIELLPSLLISPLRTPPLHHLRFNVEEEKFIYFHAYVPFFMMFLLWKMLFALIFWGLLFILQNFPQMCPVFYHCPAHGLPVVVPWLPAHGWSHPCLPRKTSWCLGCSGHSHSCFHQAWPCLACKIWWDLCPRRDGWQQQIEVPLKRGGNIWAGGLHVRAMIT